MKNMLTVNSCADLFPVGGKALHFPYDGDFGWEIVEISSPPYYRNSKMVIELKGRVLPVLMMELRPIIWGDPPQAG